MRNQDTLITSKYISDFMLDIEWLNLHPADHFPRATNHVPDMILMIGKLIKNKMAYIGEDGSVYLGDCAEARKFARLKNLF